MTLAQSFVLAAASGLFGMLLGWDLRGVRVSRKQTVLVTLDPAVTEALIRGALQKIAAEEDDEEEEEEQIVPGDEWKQGKK